MSRSILEARIVSVTVLKNARQTACVCTATQIGESGVPYYGTRSSRGTRIRHRCQLLLKQPHYLISRLEVRY